MINKKREYLKMKKNKPTEIKILAYVAENAIQHLSDDQHKQISRYVRSFRYEHHDPLQSRRMAFNKLLDEREGRLFGGGYDPEQRFAGLAIYLEYLERVEGGEPNEWKLKKLYLLSGKPMSTEDQLERLQTELHLLERSNPDVCYPVMPVECDGSVYEVLETPYFTQVYYFFD
jgi:hypothetical protein